MINLKGCAVWVLAKGYAPDEGGMQTYARSVAEAYAALGATVTVVTQTSIGPRRTHIDGVDVLDLGPDRSPLALWKFYRALRSLEIREGMPDLVHATTWRTAVPAMLRDLPYIVTFHGREFMRPRGLALAVMRRVASEAEERIAVSGYAARRLEQKLSLPRQAVTVAWNGVTTGLRFSDIRRSVDGPPVILTLCRLEPRKNIRTAVLAAALCRDAGLSFRLVICGRGPEEKAITKLVADHDLGDRVELAGYVDEARARHLYESADIFLHPQIAMEGGRDFEGFGIAVADAMYCGQAVIAGCDGGPSELVTHGSTGLLLEGSDSEAVASALCNLLTDAPLRQRMGQAAAEHARRHFCWDRHVEIILSRRHAMDRRRASHFA